MPDASQLAAVRRSIDQTPDGIKAVFLDSAFRKECLGNVAPDAKKVVKAFTKHNSESMLKTKPKVRYAKSDTKSDLDTKQSRDEPWQWMRHVLDCRI